MALLIQNGQELIKAYPIIVYLINNGADPHHANVVSQTPVPILTDYINEGFIDASTFSSNQSNSFGK